MLFRSITRVADLAAGPSKPLDNTDYAHFYRKKMTRVFVARALRRLADMGGLATGPPSPPDARRAPGNPGRSSADEDTA